MSADGIVEVYAKTEDYQFPLVLVIGRAANNEDNRLEKEGVGTYDFRKHEQTAFWNVAFAAYGKPNDLRVEEVKNIFEERSSAPVVFSDASPKGLPSTGRQDYDVSESEISAHINNIFSLDIIKRVVLVVLSGHEKHEKLLYASDLIIEKCNERKILGVKTPFMYGENQQEIIEKLKKANAFPILQEIHKKF